MSTMPPGNFPRFESRRACAFECAACDSGAGIGGHTEQGEKMPDILEQAVEACEWAYRYHHLGDETIAWDALSEKLLDVICAVKGSEYHAMLCRKYGAEREEHTP